MFLLFRIWDFFSVYSLIIFYQIEKKMLVFFPIFLMIPWYIFGFFWLCLNMYKCFACKCICASHICLDLWRPEEVSGSSTREVTDSCESCGCCDVNFGPLERHQAFLFNEPSLLPPKNLIELLAIVSQTINVLFMSITQCLSLFFVLNNLFYCVHKFAHLFHAPSNLFVVNYKYFLVDLLLIINLFFGQGVHFLISRKFVSASSTRLLSPFFFLWPLPLKHGI